MLSSMLRSASGNGGQRDFMKAVATVSLRLCMTAFKSIFKTREEHNIMRNSEFLPSAVTVTMKEGIEFPHHSNPTHYMGASQVPSSNVMVAT